LEDRRYAAAVARAARSPTSANGTLSALAAIVAGAVAVRGGCACEARTCRLRRHEDESQCLDELRAHDEAGGGAASGG
jgi:hypothetical protein